jgi:hypothetical protein
MPVILATQEAEIRRIVVQSQPGHNSSQDPILKKRGVAQSIGTEFNPQYLKKKALISGSGVIFRLHPTHNSE